MGGPSGGSSGSSDAPTTKRHSVTKVNKSTTEKVVDFVKGGGTVGYVLGKIGEANKKSKQNRMDYEGQAAGVTPMRNVRTGRDDNNDNDNPKSLVQPKVVSQMDNSKVKSDLITADKTAPTSIEMTQDEIKIANKRGKKTKTILTSVVGDKSNATLSKKVLLG
jgi:hypothetical protein